MFAGQFVPLKITTSGAEWSRWTRKYPHEGQGIPILYVIRADGEKMYARSGSLPGDELPRLLLAASRQSGRAFTAEQAALLEQVVGQAKGELQSGDLWSAAESLSSLRGLGTVGKLGSFAPLAVEADQLAATLETRLADTLAKAQRAIEDPATALEGLLDLGNVDAAAAGFPKLKAAASRALTAAGRRPTLQLAVDQATSITRARRLVRRGEAEASQRAMTIYQAVVQRHAGTPAAQLAARELDQLGAQGPGAGQPAPSSKATPTPAPPTAGPRKWTDTTGQFETLAELVQVRGGIVWLKKPDGQTVQVPLDRLSGPDREYLKSLSTRND